LGACRGPDLPQFASCVPYRGCRKRKSEAEVPSNAAIGSPSNYVILLICQRFGVGPGFEEGQHCCPAGDAHPCRFLHRVAPPDIDLGAATKGNVGQRNPSAKYATARLQFSREVITQALMLTETIAGTASKVSPPRGIGRRAPSERSFRYVDLICWPSGACRPRTEPTALFERGRYAGFSFRLCRRLASILPAAKRSVPTLSPALVEWRSS